MIGERSAHCDAPRCAMVIQLSGDDLVRAKFLATCGWTTNGDNSAYCPQHRAKTQLEHNLASQISEDNPEVKQVLDATFKEWGGPSKEFIDRMNENAKRDDARARAFMKIDEPDMVNHPAHYGGAHNPYEAIKVIDAWKLGFALGNTVKYIARAAHKGTELEDLRKARWYLNHRIEELEVENNIQLDRPVRPMPGAGK